jgi:hypothetical protein
MEDMIIKEELQMERMVTVIFKDGSKITVNSSTDCFGLLNLGNGMSLNIIHGTLYKKKGNVICGEDITSTVDTIEMSMRY